MAMATAVRGSGRDFGLPVRASGFRALPGRCTATRLRLSDSPAWQENASLTLREQRGFDDENEIRCGEAPPGVQALSSRAICAGRA